MLIISKREEFGRKISIQDSYTFSNICVHFSFSTGFVKSIVCICAQDCGKKHFVVSLFVPPWSFELIVAVTPSFQPLDILWFLHN